MKLHRISYGNPQKISSIKYLEDILSEIDNAKLTRKINTQLHILHVKLKAIESIKTYRNFYLNFVRDHTIDLIKKCNYPTKVESSLLNIVVAVIKESI